MADNPTLVKERVVGTTYDDREIIALQVTKDATGDDIEGRPAVLYNAMQHAREWLAGETCRRTLEYFVDNYGKTTSAGLEVTQLVDTRELWFVCVNNPDGNEYTFTPGNRLWRKNLRDNDANNMITNGDGVDPNRNFSSNWGRDNDGSSPRPESETYRGPSPASEPETQAMQALFDEIHPVFQKNDHTAAELLLYPQGFQQDTPSADNEIFTALAGDPFKPGIEGFLPELSAGLYITNGDFTDWAYNIKGVLSYTPEGTQAEDPNVTGFEYPDSEQQIQQEFRRHLPFVLDLAKSADDPSEPDSHLDNTADDFAVDTFTESYGDPQPVGAVVKRKLGAVSTKFKINGGPTLVVPTKEYAGGERYYKDPGVYYHRVRGVISGTNPGDSVEVWFTAGGKASAHFTYTAAVESSKPVLILANEDYTGPTPTQTAGPHYLQYYTAALDAAGVQYDVYDIDAHGRRAPDPLGILAHYSHVVWYTGDDYLTREPDQIAGSGISKLAVDTQNAVRDFMNDGGKLFYTGKNAGRQFAEGFQYNPFQAQEGRYCLDGQITCVIAQDDFLQYYLGAYRYVVGGGEDENGVPFDVDGTENPFTPLSFGFNGLDSAQNNDSTATLLTTSSVLPPAQFPLFADSKKVAAWDRPFASPFDPHDGDWFLSAGADDISYKRLLKPFAIPAGGGTVKLWTSFDLEADYDYMFVEIHTDAPPDDDWTTLEDETATRATTSASRASRPAPARRGRPTTRSSPTTRRSGPAATPAPRPARPGRGTPRPATRAAGRTGRWTSRPQYAGKNVEISVSVVTDPATLGLGVWVDQLQVVDTSPTPVPINSADPSFETGIDGWTLPGPPAPAGPAGQSDETGWARAQTAPFVEGPIVTTNDSVYTGFSFEAITGAANRNALMQSVLTHLGAPAKPAFDAPTPQPETTTTSTAAATATTTATSATTTAAAPPPGPPFTRQMALHVTSPQKLAIVRGKGLLATLGCNARCVTRVDIVVDRATQRAFKLPSRRIARRTVTVTSGQKKFRVKLTSAAKQRLRRATKVRASVQATWTGVRPAITKTRSVRLTR